MGCLAASGTVYYSNTTEDSLMTIETCISYCLSLSFQYAGLSK